MKHIKPTPANTYHYPATDTANEAITRLKKELNDEKQRTKTLNAMLNLNDSRYGAIARKLLCPD